MELVPQSFNNTLYCAWPRGELTLEKIIFIITSISTLEKSSGRPFDRFIDLSRVTAITATEESMAPVTERRKDEIVRLPEVHVRIALFASNPVNYSLARIYERMMSSPGVLVMVFSRREDAAHWLEVSPEQISPP
ncbi:hypothetical protein KKF84_08600 [Myxococcota bacterium]|nr:hypothetical protein [Myxococcota bacterium]MBU1535367.1 hypothetical protein [Myxococcota bacterium]